MRRFRGSDDHFHPSLLDTQSSQLGGQRFEFQGCAFPEVRRNRPVAEVPAVDFAGAPLVLSGAKGCSVCERAVLDFKFSS